MQKQGAAPRMAEIMEQNGKRGTCQGRKKHQGQQRKFSVNWSISTASCVTLSAKIRDKKVPIVSFVIRIIDSTKDRKVLTKLEVKDNLLKKGERFDWRVGLLPARFIIDLEFLDLKASSRNGKHVCSIWPTKIMNHQKPNSAALESVGRMLTEKIHTDVTINASDGSIGAHRAVLAARSPVFHGMFKHNLKEKDDSTINISDMSIESCQAFINYLYGIIEDEEFLKHRLELLHAANKYDICDLRDVCSESLAEDMDSSNVLERLHDSYLYQLPKLKLHCMQYLVKFGRIFDIKDDFDAFLQTVDKDLVIQLLGEVLSVWKGS
ncbi:BTB/POZ domain-containing protein At1g55760-like [Arachis stenosperma]|uniref:BTB/POZ domain-containing protein At1g55760-like n=1 Tax=Arachis stenosperma TaxID=217475 RepID=UPI0025AC6069|nr:BTB/POZ domain-containing protein At1g55760-like [Arachis stenosperma]